MSKEDIHSIWCTVHDSLGLDLTDEQVQNFYETDRRFKSEFDEWGLPDTETTSVVCDSISKKLIGREIPLIRDGKEASEKFFNDLHIAAKEQGYKTV